MILVQAIHEFCVAYRDGSRLTTDELHAQGEQLMVALLDLEKCNADISSSSTASDGIEGTVTAELMVTASNEEEALARSLVLVRTAIHTIGGATPGWSQVSGPTEPDAEYQPKNIQLEYV